MKNIVLLIAMLCFIGAVNAQNAAPADTGRKAQPTLENMAQSITTMQYDIKLLKDKISTNAGNSTGGNSNTGSANNGAGNKPQTPRAANSDIAIGLFSASPIIFLLFLFLFLRNKIDWKKALNEAILEKCGCKDTPPGVAGGQQPDAPKSSSRIVMVFSGFVALILAVCFTTVFIYGYLNGANVPDYSTLTNALLALGIGIIPYSVKQMTGK